MAEAVARVRLRVGLVTWSVPARAGRRLPVGRGVSRPGCWLPGQPGGRGRVVLAGAGVSGRFGRVGTGPRVVSKGSGAAILRRLQLSGGHHQDHHQLSVSESRGYVAWAPKVARVHESAE